MTISSAHRGGGLSGNGTVFELTPPATPGGAWTETILHKFHGSDGSTPEGRVLLMPTSSGREVLFGTTYQGGPNNAGVAFELSPSNTNDGWTEHIIYAFGAYAGDANPNQGLLSAGGRLFGVSFNGGAHAMGAVFELSPPAAAGGAWTEAIIHSFAGGNDGAFPSSELAIDSAGNVYGATTLGGAVNDGTVYRLHRPVQSGSRWAESVLHAFSGPDGSLPAGRLAVGPGGVLYGTSASGGDFSSGTVFQLAPPPSPGSPWTETVLYSFTGGRDGDEPSDGVLADTQGRLLGPPCMAARIPAVSSSRSCRPRPRGHRGKRSCCIPSGAPMASHRTRG
jgi:hypothetical protein